MAYCRNNISVQTFCFFTLTVIIYHLRIDFSWTIAKVKHFFTIFTIFIDVLISLCFYVSWLTHCLIFFMTYSLVWMSIVNSLFCCLQVLHRFYSWHFPLFFHTQYCSLICAALSHLCHLFFCFCSHSWIEFNIRS